MPVPRALITLLGVLALAASVSCRNAVNPPAATVAPASATAGASPVTTLPQQVDGVVQEVTAALEAARALRDALRQASSDPNWDRVVRVCSRYPLGPVDAAFGVRLTQGLRSLSPLPAWWPDAVTAVDTVAATTCFVTGSSAAIPPGSRVEAGGPTTAEIALQPLQAALDELRDASPQALRAMVERRARAGT